MPYLCDYWVNPVVNVMKALGVSVIEICWNYNSRIVKIYDRIISVGILFLSKKRQDSNSDRWKNGKHADHLTFATAAPL